MSTTLHSDSPELSQQFLDQGHALLHLPTYPNQPVEGVFDDTLVSVTQEDVDSPKVVAKVTLGSSAFGGFATMIGAKDLSEAFPNGATLTLSERVDGAGTRLSISGDDGPKVATAYVPRNRVANPALGMETDVTAPSGTAQEVADKLSDPKTHVLASSFVVALAKKASEAK